MLQNHIGDLRTMNDQPFGLGFQIIDKLKEGEPEGWRGCCGWGGFFTTTFAVHPQEDWLVVSMSQVVWDQDFAPAWCDKVQQLAAGAVGE